MFFVPQTQQRSFEIGQGQTARACVGKKLGAADRGRPSARDRVGVRGIRRCARSCSLGRVLKWRGSSLMITSNGWIQDSFWLLLPADLIVSQNRTIKPFFSQKNEIGHCGEAVFQTTQCGLRGTCTVMLLFRSLFYVFLDSFFAHLCERAHPQDMEALPHKKRENRTRWILQLFLGHLEVCCGDSKLARVARVGSTYVSIFCFECVVLYSAAGAVSCGRHVMPGHGQNTM